MLMVPVRTAFGCELLRALTNSVKEAPVIVLLLGLDIVSQDGSDEAAVHGRPAHAAVGVTVTVAGVFGRNPAVEVPSGPNDKGGRIVIEHAFDGEEKIVRLTGIVTDENAVTTIDPVYVPDDRPDVFAVTVTLVCVDELFSTTIESQPAGTDDMVADPIPLPKNGCTKSV